MAVAGKALLKKMATKSGGDTGRQDQHDAMDILNYGMEKLGISLKQVAEGTFITVPTLARLLEFGADPEYRCLNTTLNRIFTFFGVETNRRCGVKIPLKYQNKPKVEV